MKAALAVFLLVFAVALAKGEPTYADGYRVASAENRPLLVWVGQPRPAGDYGRVVHCEAPAFPGVVGKGCVVATPDGRGGLLRLRDMAGTPTPGQVADVLKPAPVCRT